MASQIPLVESNQSTDDYLQNEHWIKKMKKAFQVLDTDRDNAITKADIVGPLSHMMGKFNVPPEKRKEVLQNAHRYWIELVNGGNEPSADGHGVSEEEFLKNVARAVTNQDFDRIMEAMGTALLTLLNLKNPNSIAKEEFLQINDAHNVPKEDAEHLFDAIATRGEGCTKQKQYLTRSDYVAAVQFFFTDRTNVHDRRNALFGPLS